MSLTYEFWGLSQDLRFLCVFGVRGTGRESESSEVASLLPLAIITKFKKCIRCCSELHWTLNKASGRRKGYGEVVEFFDFFGGRRDLQCLNLECEFWNFAHFRKRLEIKWKTFNTWNATSHTQRQWMCLLETLIYFFKKEIFRGIFQYRTMHIFEWKTVSLSKIITSWTHFSLFELVNCCMEI